MAVSEAQKAAQKRYNEKNRAERARLRDRSATRSFIRNKADLTEIEELRTMLNERESLLKIIELKETLDRSERGFPSITIWKNKAEIIKTLQTNGDEDVDWATQVAEAYVDFEKDEKIIEVDLGNAWPEKFHAHEFGAINEYIK
jgi:hypothetical protein